MSNLIENGLRNAFRWVCCGRRRRPRRCNNCDPCANPLLEIKYSWGGGMHDLDTGTTFLGDKAGWSCGSGGDYMSWSGDDTSADGTETITVDVEKALDDGAWASSVVIDCAAGWYIPAGGSGSATLTVKYRGDTQTKTVSPGSQSSCATTGVATITVYDDGTFSLA